MADTIKLPNFALAKPKRQGENKYGTLAEWLGTGLQNRLQQFDSARYLSKDLGDDLYRPSPKSFLPSLIFLCPQSSLAVKFRRQHYCNRKQQKQYNGSPKKTYQGFHEAEMKDVKHQIH